ncbi:hypothetical protein ABDK10_05470 [Staphylococcus aureus]
MRPILFKTKDKAERYDAFTSKNKWDKLTELLNESSITIKTQNEHEILLQIPGEVKADIELYPSFTGYENGFVNIVLWYYTFSNNNTRYESRLNIKGGRASYQASTVSGALNFIDTILYEIEQDKKIRKIYS